jgi:hypothetical protein
MLDQAQTLGGTKTITAKPKAKKGSRYLKPPAKIARQIAKGTLVDWETSKDVNSSALLIAGCHASQTSADAFIDGIPQGAATAALIKSSTANPAISYRNLVTNMQQFMVDGNFTQVPQLDGSESLYDMTFLEPFKFAIAATPEDEPAVTEDEPAVTEEQDVPPYQMSMSTPVTIGAAIIAFVIAVIAFFFG